MPCPQPSIELAHFPNLLPPVIRANRTTSLRLGGLFLPSFTACDPCADLPTRPDHHQRFDPPYLKPLLEIYRVGLVQPPLFGHSIKVRHRYFMSYLLDHQCYLIQRTIFLFDFCLIHGKEALLDHHINLHILKMLSQ